MGGERVEVGVREAPKGVAVDDVIPFCFLKLSEGKSRYAWHMRMCMYRY